MEYVFSFIGLLIALPVQIVAGIAIKITWASSAWENGSSPHERSS